MSEFTTQKSDEEVKPVASMQEVYDAVASLLDVLQRAKGPGRTAKDRAVAVAYTDAQRLMAWIKVWCFE